LLFDDSAGEFAYTSPAGCDFPFTLLHPTGLAIDGLFKIGLSIDGVLLALGGPEVEAANSGPFLATILNDLPFNASLSLRESNFGTGADRVGGGDGDSRSSGGAACGFFGGLPLRLATGFSGWS
jgi:hypothetical protein